MWANESVRLLTLNESSKMLKEEKDIVIFR
jgi:hypothetical protein